MLANAEVSGMNYWLYKQDIARLAAVGIPYYSFSILWTRIVPFGVVGSPINTLGLAHYDDVINTCVEYGITPIVTLLHFDSPQAITYTSPDFPDAYLYYAKQVMTRYSDRVSHWITHNEPNMPIQVGTNYSGVYNVLMSHAKIYHWYKEVLNGTSLISLKFANNLATPFDSDNPNDVRAALRYQDFALGIMGNPIFLGKQYPAEVLNTTGIAIEPLSAADLAYINGTADYISVDPYAAGFATSAPNGIDACAANSSDPL